MAKETEKEFERMLVYRCPGQYPAGKHGTYDDLAVESQADLDAALKEGWAKSIPEAAEKAKAPAKATAK